MTLYGYIEEISLAGKADFKGKRQAQIAFQDVLQMTWNLLCAPCNDLSFSTDFIANICTLLQYAVKLEDNCPGQAVMTSVTFRTLVDYVFYVPWLLVFRTYRSDRKYNITMITWRPANFLIQEQSYILSSAMIIYEYMKDYCLGENNISY